VAVDADALDALFEPAFEEREQAERLSPGRKVRSRPVKRLVVEWHIAEFDGSEHQLASASLRLYPFCKRLAQGCEDRLIDWRRA
jgi:hypothetical protein